MVKTIRITQCHYFGFFPQVHMLSTGELFVTEKMDPDDDTSTLENCYWAFVVSRDRGQSWGIRHTEGMVYEGNAAYIRLPRPDGCILMLAGFPTAAAPGDYRQLKYYSVRICDHTRSVLFQRDVLVALPHAAYRIPIDYKVNNFASPGPGKFKAFEEMVFNGTILSSRDGRLLTTMYGKLAGDKYDRTLVVRSNAEGKRWQYVTTVAGGKNAVLLPGETGTEGFNEPRMIRLRDGRLFLVMRRGSNNVMFKSWSTDEGRIWTTPKSIGFKGVKPALWLMKSGLLVLSTGRPGPVSLYFSRNGGETWSSPFVIFRGRGTRYTDVIEVSPNRLLVVYDHVPYDWGVIPDDKPNAMNEILGTFLDVSEGTTK